MTRKEIKEIIKAEVTIEHALSWYESVEKLLNFDYGFNDEHLGLYCTDDAEKFDYALDLFEEECERLLTERLKTFWLNPLINRA